MPVYNGERYVDEAIASVLTQDFEDFEFVIVDDGSTDATRAIVERWAACDPRIVVVRAAENGGIPRSLNRGLAVARGRYVARHDADDLCLPGRLRRQVEVLDREPDVVLVSAGYELIDASGTPLGLEMRTDAPEVVAHLLHFSNAIGGHGQVMFRRDVVASIGGYREDFELAEDYDLWTRLSKRGRIVLLPIVGMKHRQHDQRVSVTAAEEQRACSLRISRRMLEELLQRPVADEEEDALSAVWRQEGRPGATDRAEALLREAYARFRGTRRHARGVRFATSRRWVRSSAALLRRGIFREALRQLAIALRWHPVGAAAGVAYLARRAVVHARRGAPPAPQPPPTPRVSVLMTAFNGSRFIDQAIASVLAQDDQDFELVIVDDGSTDATPAILARWAAQDPRIRVHRHEENLGNARAANTGLALARGAFIARLDADDVCLRGRLRAEVEWLERNRDTVLVSTNYEVIDEYGRRLTTERRAAPPAVIEHLMHFSNAIGGHSQVMFRRDDVIALGGYDERAVVCVDYELWSRLVRRGRFVVLPIVGMQYRLHGGSVSAGKPDEQRAAMREISCRMLAQLLGRELAHPEAEALHSVWYAAARPGTAMGADRLLRETYARVAKHRGHVRRAIARRWMFAAAAFARKGNLRETAVHSGFAFRWHPLGAIVAASVIVARTLCALRLRKEVDAARLPLGQQVEETRA